MNRKKEIERKKERNANKGEKSKGTIEYHPSIPAVRELNSRRKRIRNARWRCQKERVRVRSVERQKPVVDCQPLHPLRWIYTQSDSNVERWKRPSPSPPLRRIRTAIHRFVITLYTRHTPLSLSLPRETRISRYNLLFAGKQKEFLASLPPSFQPRNDHPSVYTPIKIPHSIDPGYFNRKKKSNVNRESSIILSQKRKKKVSQMRSV